MTVISGRGYPRHPRLPVLAQIDRRGSPSYLATQNEKMIPLYGHLGFAIIDQIASAGMPFMQTGASRQSFAVIDAPGGPSALSLGSPIQASGSS